MSTPSVEYRNTLAAVVLTVFTASHVKKAESCQYVIPADPKNDSPSRWNDQRVITNHPSKATRAIGRRINSGDYISHLLNSIKGLQYEVRVARLHTEGLDAKELASYIAETKAKARSASFAFVDGNNIVSIYAMKDGVFISSWKAFADTCGLVIGNSAKINKRLKEIARLTRMFVRLPELDIRIIEADFPKIAQMHVDGVSLVRMSVALKTARDRRTRKLIQTGHIVRVSIRIISPLGLIKGDALIVPDENIPADVYTSKHNIKDELKTKSGFTITMEPHHPSSQARTNQQVESWFPELCPVDQQRFAVWSFLQENLTKLRAGEYPMFMSVLPKLQNGLDQMILFRSSVHKWISHGLKINQSAALLKQAGNTVTKQLISDPKIVTRDNGVLWRDYSKQKVRVPIVHAFYGHIMTDTIIKLAGYSIPKGAKGKLFYHAETHSVVIPASHFAKFYRNHGGWDLDDSAMFILRKIDGKLKVIIIRSPNSWGEYSIIDVHLDGLPLHNTYGDIPELTSGELPTMITDLDIEDPERDRSLPTGTFKREEEYGFRDFDYALDCAVINPGTGAAINLLCIAFNSIFGTYNRNPIADTEDVVDTTQQNPSLEGLTALNNHLKAAKKELVAAVMSGVPVDRLVFENRLNLSDKEKAKLRPLANIVDGRFTQVKNMVREEIKLYSAELHVLATIAHGTEKLTFIKGIDEPKVFVGGRMPLDFQNVDLAAIEDEGTEKAIWEMCGKASDASRGAPGEIIPPAEVRRIWSEFSTKLAARLRNTENDQRRDLVVLNFMNWTYQYEKLDTAFFGTSPVIDDIIQDAPMDILLEAMVRHGMAVAPVIEE